MLLVSHIQAIPTSAWKREPFYVLEYKNFFEFSLHPIILRTDLIISVFSLPECTLLAGIVAQNNSACSLKESLRFQGTSKSTLLFVRAYHAWRC